jgi:crossover junction endodeoxyribonuclease RusA
MLTLPFPPSSNRYWRHGQGRTYKSEQARQYQESTAWIARLAGATLHSGKVGMELRFFHTGYKGDLDNLQKILLDSLEGVLYNNDRQIRELHAYLADSKTDPRVEATVWPLT